MTTMQPATHTGLLEWSNAIRLSMANDPGRQLFHDQVNTHGFLFLQDYMDNILCKTKQDPLIELVKTPGRKKAVSKKLKPQSKLNNVVSLSFEVDGHSKENLAPINTFHKALLKAKDTEHTADTTPLQTKSSSLQHSTEEEYEEIGTIAVTLAPTVIPSPTDQDIHAERKTELLPPTHIETNELSVIAEDDENAERSRISIHLLSRERSASAVAPPENNMNMTGSSSDTFHSINLDSPRSLLREKNEVLEMIPSAHSAQTSDVVQCNPNYTAQIPPWNPPIIHNEAVAEPLPNDPVASSLILVQTAEAIVGGDLGLTDISPFDSKSAISLFPALPAPMPLRKSMRTPRDPSMGMVTPGATLGGRTSWLKKAREVKAMEGTARNISTAAASGPSVLPTSLPNTLKRKSGDALTIPETTGLEGEERRPKSAKNMEGDVAPLKPRAPEYPQKEEIPGNMELQASPQHPQEGMLDRFKRTVEGLGARVGKSMGKSLGAGAAVSALAEARAAAEARVAERNHKEDGLTRAIGAPVAGPLRDVALAVEPKPIASMDKNTPSQDVERRLSISDLFPPNDGKAKIKTKASEKVFQFTPTIEKIPSVGSKLNRESTTTTPPDSPPATRLSSFDSQPVPVFNKPPPVFVPPVPANKPIVAAAKGFATRPPSPKQPVPLSAQSTLESVKPDSLFDDDAPTWLPATQDTEFSSRFGSQPQEQNANVLDEDDSWPIDEKLAAGVQWSFGIGMDKEDSMTWSTLPSQSQRADTGPMNHDDAVTRTESAVVKASSVIPGAFVDMDEEEYEGDGEIGPGDSELEEMVMTGKSTVGLVESKHIRSESQMSMVSSVSSQSQPGFLGQASKLLSSALGTSKKGKPGVEKVLQMAAVAAKKQQEENDKKAARLKEMENRRQLAMQRKTEEEKARSQEQERKLKEEGERRKREREETTEKRPLKMATGGKKDDDNTKKRKITVEVEKKPELKKPGPKPTLKFSMKQPAALSSSAAYNASLQTIATSMTKPPETKPSKSSTTLQKGKAPVAKMPIPDDDLSQPSQLVQIQMAARAKAQLQAAKQVTESTVQSESIELPDINSEYSDSEDEDRPRTFDPPGWAQSPELRQALQVQSTINPDDIFGAIRPLRMEELFKTRTSRFRARTSSANWTGSDRLTVEEEREYARRMGFR